MSKVDYIIYKRLLFWLVLLDFCHFACVVYVAVDRAPRLIFPLMCLVLFSVLTGMFYNEGFHLSKGDKHE